MTTNKTWGELLQEELQDDPEYQVELLVLRVNGAIRRRMREAGITQTDLAAKLGVSQPYISKLLNYNANLTLRSLARIAWALEAEWAEPQLMPQAARSDFEAEHDSEALVECEMSVEATKSASDSADKFVPYEPEHDNEEHPADGFTFDLAA